MGRWDLHLESCAMTTGAPNQRTAAQSDNHAARLYSEVEKLEEPIAFETAAPFMGSAWQTTEVQ